MLSQHEYADQDAVGLAELVRSGAVTAGEVLDTALSLVDALDGELNAIVTVLAEHARDQVAAGLGGGPLAGAPIVLKDEYQFLPGAPTQHAARISAGLTQDHPTELVERYRCAGVVIAAKANLPEFGASVTCEPVATGTTRNPWRLDRTVGGSSGGSSAAVAAGIVPLGYANDGAGSIRIPASCNGVFGLKPSRGRVPTGPDNGDLWNGLVIEHAVTRSVRDSAALLDATAGADLGAPYAAPAQDGPFLTEVDRAPGEI
ncbi:MAG: amidase, partial [Streptosporangiales bacterium]|nr:amidase [Streptosporangiales bacterium]